MLFCLEKGTTTGSSIVGILSCGTFQLTKIENLETLVNLEEIDLSFNRIERIEGLGTPTNLNLVHNKLVKIDNLKNLTALEYLELGDNKIKKIEGLEKNANIVRLFLGANQVTGEGGKVEKGS